MDRQNELNQLGLRLKPGVWGAMEQKTDLRTSSGNLSSLAASRKV